MIYGIVKNQKLDLRAAAAADTIDYLTAKFSFMSSDWEGLVKYAHFKQGTNVFSVQLIDDKIDETDHLNLTKGEWEVYLHGNEYKNGEVKKRITTNIAKFTVEPTGALNGEPFPEVQPSVVEQLGAEVEDIADRVTEIEQSGAKESILDVKDSHGVSVVIDRIAHLPAEVVEIYGTDGLKYTPSEVDAMSRTKALLYQSKLVLRVRDQMPIRIKIYYISDATPYELTIRSASYTGRGVFEGDELEGSWLLPTERTKLAGIEEGAQVNTITDVQNEQGESLVESGVAVIPAAVGSVTDVQDSEGHSLVDENGVATLPEIPEQIQSDWEQSDSSKADYIKNKPSIVTPVQPDWNEADSSALDYIKNKPQTELTAAEMVTVCSILNDFIQINNDILGVDSSTALAF